jgi:hydrogenase maturation protease
MKTLILGLGNELAGDDAIGLLAARALNEQLGENKADVVESSASGMALLEILAGYERAIVIDSILSGENPPGTIRELALAEVGRVVAPSLHHAGLPEMAAAAERLGLRFPSQTRVFAVEVSDPYTLGAPVGEQVAGALAELVWRVRERVEDWEREDAAGS